MRKSFFSIVILFFVGAVAHAAESSGSRNYGRPFETETKRVFIALPPGAVEPAGWLRDWCLAAKPYALSMEDRDVAFRQAWSLDYTLADKRLSLWYTGSWPYEGGGYWFDGMSKLGFVLHDKELIELTRKRLGAVVDRMNDKSILFMWWLDKNNSEHIDAAEGRGTPEPEWPIWANGLLGRAMVGYYAGAADKKILKTLEWAFSGKKEWTRMGVGMSTPWPAFEAYSWTGNAVIKEALTELFTKDGDLNRPFSWYRYRRPPKDQLGAEEPAHGVLFYESAVPWALGYLWTGQREFLDTAMAWCDYAERNSMQPYGVPRFDEYWGPPGAFVGTETCTVGAYIWTQNLLLGISGQGKLADRIERAFFNAAPATVDRDFRTHAYFQSPNRIADNSLPKASLYSFMPKHVPLCCTASLNRILPNYVINMWMATQDDGLAAVCYGPCKVSALVADRVPVELVCKTDYPFGESIEISVAPSKEAKFPLLLRIPGWCKNAEIAINGETVSSTTDGNGFVRIERTWKANDKIAIRFPMSPCVATGKDENAGGARYETVSYGPLLFALPIADMKDANTPDPAAKWRYALADDESGANLSIAVERGAMPAKWDWPLESPLRLHVDGTSFDWKPTLEQSLPKEPVESSAPRERLTLVPYGCTKFRVSMFPVMKADESQRWSEKAANEWYARQPWLVGTNYTPADAINQLEMWQADTFSPERIDMEFGWAEGLGMNTMRVFLHDQLWEQDAEGFKKRLDTFLGIAAKHKIRPLFVLFDSCWHPAPKLGPQCKPRPGVHNSGWLQSPGAAALADPAQYPRLEAYVKGVVGAFAHDQRILGWDVWNEPDNTAPSPHKGDPANKAELVLQLLPLTFAWARAAKPEQPLTSGVCMGDWSSDGNLAPIQKVQLEMSDVISFHCYETPEGFERRVASLKRFGRPLFCTEYLARSLGSTFQGVLPLAKKDKVAMFNWGFVAGKTQTYLPWDSWERPYTDRLPPVWHHDLLHWDGWPYDAEEAKLIRDLTHDRSQASETSK